MAYRKTQKKNLFGTFHKQSFYDIEIENHKKKIIWKG